LAVGKLTNVALALKKDPSITQRIRVVWLGSNYPEPGEYNQDNDTIAMNYVLNTEVDFEMVTVRYGKPSGTDAIRVTKEEINKRMPGKGPKISTPVKGRHELAFNTFGDYSVNLFEHITYHGDPPARALFDMAAVAIVKNPSWATAKQIPCPILINNQWVERPENRRKITIWENFDRDKIMKDFYQTMDHYILAAE
jgi:inosine-uridine nucleoside N-ribohydrolase